MALRLCRMAKMCSGGVMTETRLDVLLLSPHLRPPISQLYLREATGFYASRIHYLKGKNWQIRSLKDGRGCFFIVPVTVNTGGSAYNRPIISEVLLRHFIPKFDRAISGEKSTKGKIHLPTPLGDDFNLGAQGWNDAREKDCCLHVFQGIWLEFPNLHLVIAILFCPAGAGQHGKGGSHYVQLDWARVGRCDCAV